MKIREVMQLNAVGSKILIKQAKNENDKRKYIFAFVLKNMLLTLFSMVFVTAFFLLFGIENSIPGVIALIAVQMFKSTDLGFDAKQSAWTIVGLFALLAVGPKLSNLASGGLGLLINIVCIFMFLILTCHNVVMSNHSTFVLGYLLLWGSDVSGRAYIMRIMALMVGGIMTALVFYKAHKNIPYRRRFTDIFREFHMSSVRGKWQMKMALAVSLVLTAATLLKLQRPMWAGIACMSVMQPFTKDITFRVMRRAPFTVGGCLIFCLLYSLFPQIIPYIGILGGFLVSFSGTYKWQTVFNCFGALTMGVGLFGLGGAILFRIINNVLGTLFSITFSHIFDILLQFFQTHFAGKRLLNET